MMSEKVLAAPMQENDAGAATVKEYLMSLLMSLWLNGESFSGKRPFGNSGWELELFHSLVHAGLLKGTVNEDGYADDYNRKDGEKLITEAIKHLFK
jgi:hypothetical protein